MEEDYLEIYYAFAHGGSLKYLLSNNMNVTDRVEFHRIWKAHDRASGLAMFAGFALGLETVTRHAYFKKMALGWRVCSFFGVAYGFKCLFNTYNAHYYGPLMGAYLRRYDSVITADRFEMVDRKREYYEIDTSQYMSYTDEDLHSHVNHGPQPDGEHMDASWLSELDLFLSTEMAAALTK